MFNIHVKAPWRVIKSALPQMRSQGDGLIINISSGLGRFSAPFMTVYNSAKFAIEGLSEGLHYEVRPLGIDVALILPGAFPTEIFGNSKPVAMLQLLPDMVSLQMCLHKLVKDWAKCLRLFNLILNRWLMQLWI